VGPNKTGEAPPEFFCEIRDSVNFSMHYA